MKTRRAASIGFFDGVHLGHRFLARQLKTVADERGLRPVLVTFDRHPLEVVRPDCLPQLLTTNEERLALLQTWTGTDIEVLPFSAVMSRMTAREFMQKILSERLGVELLLMGYDHRFGHGGGTAEEYVQWGKEVGIEVMLAEEREGEHVSSSTIRQLISQGNVTDATQLLGYRYFLAGTVVSGKQLGRQIGFPTANIEVPREKLLPGCGVYAVTVKLPDGTQHGGMLCIGRRPTIDNDGKVSVEVNVFDFQGDLYGKSIRLEMVSRLREERQFASIDALRRQLAEDAVAAQNALKA